MLSIIPRAVAIKIIRLYQKILSPDHGLLKFKHPYGYCRYQPTCSEYAIDSLKKHGLWRGGAKALWRVTRCTPWSKGGWDPVK